MRLAQGDVAAAAASIRDALERPLRVPSKERPPNTDLQRAPLLEAQVEIEIAAGDLDRARSAADELELVAARFESKALVASAALAQGRVRLAEGDAADAEQLFSEAARLWNEVGAPYEAALARMGLADAHRAGGSEHRADLELQAARAILERIEAAPDRQARQRASRTATHWTTQPAETATPSVARATTGRWRSRGARCGCATSRACGTSRGSSPIPGGSSTCWTSSRPRPAALAGRGSRGRPVARGLGDAGEMLDARAKEAYRRRLAEIDEDIEEAQADRRHRAGRAGRRRTRLPRSRARPARSASAAAIDEPGPRPSVPGSA